MMVRVTNSEAAAPREPEPVRRWHAELAWLGRGTAGSRGMPAVGAPGPSLGRDVLIEAHGARFTAVTPDVPAAQVPPGTVRLPGLTLPGLANAHSHAFHRALRGSAGGAGGAGISTGFAGGFAGGSGAGIAGRQADDTFWTWRE